MIAMVLASALIKARSDAPRLGQRELELSHSGLGHGLGDVARVLSALGGVALYAWVLGVVGRLQFEVFQYRMRSEYGVEVEIDSLGFTHARWITGEGASAVAGDLEKAFEAFVDENRPWGHLHEGDRNPWSHVRAALTASSVSIPLTDGRLALGGHQAVFLAEFDGPRVRTIRITVTR